VIAAQPEPGTAREPPGYFDAALELCVMARADLLAPDEPPAGHAQGQEPPPGQGEITRKVDVKERHPVRSGR
jgi:hypothetical protein